MPSGRRFDPVLVRAVGRPWVLPGRPALAWINSCRGTDNTFPYVFPGMVARKDAWSMWEAWTAFDDMERRCTNTARVALGRAARREWWWTHNLINEAVDSWTSVNGRLVREGVRAGDESLPNWLDAAFMVMASGMAEDDRTAFQARLSLPPKNAHIAQTSSATRAALMAFAAF